jgi:hypothetical protein
MSPNYKFHNHHDNGRKHRLYAIPEYEYYANGNMIADMNRNMKLMYGFLHNMPIVISFDQVGGGGGGSIIEDKSSDDVRQAATTSYSGDIINSYTSQGRSLGSVPKKTYI